MPSDRGRKKYSVEILRGVGMPRNVSDYAENTLEKFHRTVIISSNKTASETRSTSKSYPIECTTFWPTLTYAGSFNDIC